MNRKLNILKTLGKVLLSSFFAAFIGAGWVAYAASQSGGLGQVWIPLSALGAIAACALIFGLGRSFSGGHLLN